MRAVEIFTLLAVVAATAWVIYVVARRHSRLLRAECAAVWEPVTDDGDQDFEGWTIVNIQRRAQYGNRRWVVESERVAAIPPGSFYESLKLDAQGEAIARALDKNEREGRNRS